MFSLSAYMKNMIRFLRFKFKNLLEQDWVYNCGLLLLNLNLLNDWLWWRWDHLSSLVDLHIRWRDHNLLHRWWWNNHSSWGRRRDYDLMLLWRSHDRGLSNKWLIHNVHNLSWRWWWRSSVNHLFLGWSSVDWLVLRHWTHWWASVVIRSWYIIWLSTDWLSGFRSHVESSESCIRSGLGLFKSSESLWFSCVGLLFRCRCGVKSCEAIWTCVFLLSLAGSFLWIRCAIVSSIRIFIWKSTETSIGNVFPLVGITLS